MVENNHGPIKCSLCGGYLPRDSDVSVFVEHLKTCNRKLKDHVENDEIDFYSCKGVESRWHYQEMSTQEGLVQKFAMYVKPYAKMEYDVRKLVRFSRVGGIVTLASFYDFGRLPLHLGGDYGRVMWVALDGSKWINFRDWASFRWRVLNRDNGVCQMCNKVVGNKITEGKYAGLWDNRAIFVCDHVIPLALGGKDWWEDPEMSNFQTLCVPCNKVKTKADMGDIAEAREVEKTQMTFQEVVNNHHSLLEYV